MKFASILALTQVSASSHNTVSVDSSSIGSIYIGSSFLPQNVIYDTTVSYTALNIPNKHKQAGHYDYKKSSTMATRTKPTKNVFEYKDVKFSGPILKDQMCLKQRNKIVKKYEEGELCVKAYDFTDVYEHAAEIGANGVLGLGPGGEESYVR